MERKGRNREKGNTDIPLRFENNCLISDRERRKREVTREKEKRKGKTDIPLCLENNCLIFLSVWRAE